MTKLGWVVIKAFSGPFILNFIVWMLLLDMQSLWLYIDDLMGKGLEWYIILELMFYFSANWVPLALPLSLLLASIMAFGKLGETNELTAMKASGMSLFRIMRPLLVIVIGISVFAFYFTNYLLPGANFKLRVLISDIQETKAAIVFKEGVFYDELEGYNILIGKKHPDGKTFDDILIYDYTAQINNYSYNDPRDYKRVISAKSGKIVQSKKTSSLMLELFDGVIVQEMNPKEVDNSTMPYSRYYFDKTSLQIQLQSFAFERSEIEQYEADLDLMSFKQLSRQLDTLYFRQQQLAKSYFEQHKMHFYVTRYLTDSTIHSVQPPTSVKYVKPETDSVLYKKLLMETINRIDNIAISMQYSILEKQATESYLAKASIKMHEKFTLSYAVLMLFFLGASLGAIVKKGGLGVPVLIAILLFLIYFILTRGGMEMADSMTLSPVAGMWLSAFILTPVAIFVFIKAKNDSKIFEMSFYTSWLNVIMRWFKKNESTSTVS
jgi:lipopolysaccharide export system permease protein